MKDRFDYYIDHDDLDTIVRSAPGCLEQLYKGSPVWKHAAECYWREIYLGQGFGCLTPITEEEALEIEAQWTAEAGFPGPLTPESPTSGFLPD